MLVDSRGHEELQLAVLLVCLDQACKDYLIIELIVSHMPRMPR